MAMQRMEIHFIIDGQGHIQSVVKGIKGSGCKAVIEEIKKIGYAVSESPTAEIHEGKGETGIQMVKGKP
jgi:hypothetical protein